MATITVEQQWAFKSGARVPGGVHAEDVVREKEQMEDHLGRLATTEEAAEMVLRWPTKYKAHRAFAPATEKEALHEAVVRGVRSAWSSVIQVDVEITEVTNRISGDIEIATRRVDAPEVRWFHAVPARVGDTQRVYDSLPNIAADADKEAALSEDLATQARNFSAKVASVTGELARLHKLRSTAGN
jgi:hypothetical protein